MEKRIRDFLKDKGATLVGFCQTEGIRTYGEIRLLPYAISAGIRLSETVLETVTDRPSLIYKHHYRTINHYLDQLALRITRFLEDHGYQALPIGASQTIDWERQLGHLSHLEIGRRAGLGWIGRSGLLINPRYGAQVRYVSILTDLELPTVKELPFGCGDCYKCLDGCPARA
ncbi:MAG TPA: hypothetical protein EYP24_02795, partial [bacterium (Candidatus Stahlbacteria)]|nr:hypothetical protein [Candidatus Stahlbacteria bacterium]